MARFSISKDAIQSIVDMRAVEVRKRAAQTGRSRPVIDVGAGSARCLGQRNGKKSPLAAIQKLARTLASLMEC